MDVAIRGDHSSCLSMQLGAHTWLFAVARGFGAIDGVPVAPATLGRVRLECERRVRSERFRRAISRPQGAAAALLGALARVNSEIFVRSAAHDDYVSAACSFSALLVVRGHAFAVHTGRTAIYLAHGAEVSAVTCDDAFDDAHAPLLRRALGCSSALDVSVSNLDFEAGDVVILAAERMRGAINRAALIAHVEDARDMEELLVVRFDASDRGIEERVPLTRRARPRIAACAYAIAAGAIAYLFTMGWAN